MWKWIVTLSLSLIVLAACGGPEPINRDDPFESLYPWDGERKGVRELNTGIEIFEIEAGQKGGLSPAIGDLIIVSHEGRALETGTVFESSFANQTRAAFGVGQRFGGWFQTVSGMSEGDEWMARIPSALAFGERGRGDRVKPGEDVLYRIKLHQVVKPQTSDASAWERHLPWDGSNPDVVTTESGLQYITLEEGNTSQQRPSRDATVYAFYEGKLAESGEKFDSAFDRGTAFETAVTRVIPGWTEMLMSMHPGQRVIAYIPAELGYGAQGYPGVIPPNADLVFEMKLMAALEPAKPE